MDRHTWGKQYPLNEHMPSITGCWFRTDTLLIKHFRMTVSEFQADKQLRETVTEAFMQKEL